MTKFQVDQCFELFFKALPKDMRAMKQDLSRSFRVAMSAVLANMDMVTREEFDVQARLLSRTRERLDELQSKLDEISGLDS